MDKRERRYGRALVAGMSTMALAISPLTPIQALGEETKVQSDEMRVASAIPDGTPTGTLIYPEALDKSGLEQYVLISPCSWGAHTYYVKSDATASADMDIAKNGRTPGNNVPIRDTNATTWHLQQDGSNLYVYTSGDVANRRYLTCNSDKTYLTTSDTKTVSGLSIDSDGSLLLADDDSKCVSLQVNNTEPKAGQKFSIVDKTSANQPKFLFARMGAAVASAPSVRPETQPMDNFQAVVTNIYTARKQMYRQYVIFAEINGKYIPLNGEGKGTTPLSCENGVDVDQTITSAATDTLFTISQDWDKPIDVENRIYYQYIRSWASLDYITSSGMTSTPTSEFRFVETNGIYDGTALLATVDDKYLSFDGENLSLVDSEDDATVFHFAYILSSERQTSDIVTAAPMGQMAKIINWDNIVADGTHRYMISNANENWWFHYALDGSGRAIDAMTELTARGACQDEKGAGNENSPCDYRYGDYWIFPNSGDNESWTAEMVDGKLAMRNLGTGLYLQLDNSPARHQTSAVSNEVRDALMIEGTEVYRQLKQGSEYLKLWDYYTVAASDSNEYADWYLLEVTDWDDLEPIKVDVPQMESSTDYAFSGAYSVYKASQHVLDYDMGMVLYTMMKGNTDEATSWEPDSDKYQLGVSNYDISYCIDTNKAMNTYGAVETYHSVPCEENSDYDADQCAAFSAMISHMYPYVTIDYVKAEAKKHGYELSEYCGEEEIIAGTQAALYSISNPEDIEDTGIWGYNGTNAGWTHNSYTFGGNENYITDKDMARQDVNTVRDFLLSLTDYDCAAAAKKRLEAMNEMGGLSFFGLGDSDDDGDEQLGGNTKDYKSIISYRGDINNDNPSCLVISDNAAFADTKLESNLSNNAKLGASGWYFDESHTLKNFTQDVFKSTGQTYYYYDYRPAVHYSVYFDSETKAISGTPQIYITSTSSSSARSYSSGDRINYYGNYMMEADENGYIKLGSEPDLSSNIYMSQFPLAGKYVGANENGELVLTDAPDESTTYHLVSPINEIPVYSTELYSFDSYDVNYGKNADNTGAITVSGSLNREIDGCYDELLIEIVDTATGASYANTTLKYGDKTFSLTADNVPENANIITRSTIIMRCVSPKLLFSEDVTHQTQISAAMTSVYYSREDTFGSLPVMKIWDDDKNHDNDTVTVRLVEQILEDGDNNSGDTNQDRKSVQPEQLLVLSKDNNWHGYFSGVPVNGAGYGYADSYYFYPGNESIKKSLYEYQYDIIEDDVKGYTASYEYKVPPFDVNTIKQPDSTPLVIQISEAPASVEEAAVLQDSGDFIADENITVWDWESGIAQYVPGKTSQLSQIDKSGSLVPYGKYGKDDVIFNDYLVFCYIFEENDSNYAALCYENDNSGYSYLINGFILPEENKYIFPSEEYCFERASIMPYFEDGNRQWFLQNNMNMRTYVDDFYAWTAHRNGEQILLSRESNEITCDSELVPVTGGYVIKIIEDITPIPDGSVEQLDTQISYVKVVQPEGFTYYTAEEVEDFSEATVFQIYNDAPKMMTITNSPDTSIGGITIKKVVSGNELNPLQLFTFTLNIHDADYNEEVDGVQFTNGVATFTLLGGQEKTIYGLPAGASYTVTETDIDHYLSTSENATGTIPAADTIVSTFTNRHEPVTSISGTWAWNDSNNRDGLRADGKTIKVMNGDTVVGTYTIPTNADNGTYSFTELPKYNAADELINYEIVVDDIAGYDNVVGTDNTVSLTHEAAKKNFSGSITWSDNNNQDGVRPTSVTVALKNGAITVDEKTVAPDADGNWNYTFENAFVNDGGNAIAYTIEQVGLTSKYTVTTADTANGVNFTNTHTPNKITVTGQITWNDGNNKDNIRPASVEVKLKNGDATVETVTVNAINNWHYSFAPVDEKAAGTTIPYAVEAPVVDKYTSSLSGYNITMSHIPVNVDLAFNGTFTWNDDNNRDGLRPATQTVILKADGVKVAEVSIDTSKSSSTYNLGTFPKLSSTGTEVTYDIEVIAPSGYVYNINNKNITMTHDIATTDISGTVSWDDDDNRDGLRPEKVSVSLLANGTVVATANPSKYNGWQYAFNNKPTNASGSAITYTIEQNHLGGYTTTVNNTSIMNKHTPAKKEVSGIITWNDSADKDGIRPETATVYLLKDGTSITSVIISAEDGWKFSFPSVYENEDGSQIEYTISMETPDGYTAKVVGTNIVATHVSLDEKTQIGGTIVWDDDDNARQLRPDSVLVRVIANGEVVAEKLVKAEDGWNYVIDELPKYNEDETEIEYTVEQEAIKNYTTTIDGTTITNTIIPEKVDDSGEASDYIETPDTSNPPEQPAKDAPVSDTNDMMFFIVLLIGVLIMTSAVVSGAYVRNRRD